MTSQAFTGEEIAHVLHLDLTFEELFRHLDNERKQRKWWTQIIKKFQRPKLYVVYGDSPSYGFQVFIHHAENEYEACIRVVPFLAEAYEAPHTHHNLPFDKTCQECILRFNRLAEWLNNSHVKMIGWATDYTALNILCLSRESL